MHQDEGSIPSQILAEQVAPLSVAAPTAYPTDLPAASCDLNAAKTRACTLIDKARTKKTSRPKKRRRKVGGWPSTTGFRYPEVKSIIEGAFRIQSSGKDFTAFVTIKPPPELAGDQVRKLWCRRKLYNFQRKLARRDLPFIALSVFEKPLDGQLHLHALIHVPMKFFPELQKMENLPEIDVKLRHGKSLSYVLKNRLPTHPDFEPVLAQTLRRRRGASFRGKRWLFSHDAHSIIRKAKPATA